MVKLNRYRVIDRGKTYHYRYQVQRRTFLFWWRYDYYSSAMEKEEDAINQAKLLTARSQQGPVVWPLPCKTKGLLK